MKKFLLLTTIVACLTFAPIVKAQSGSSGTLSFSEGKMVIGAGYGFGNLTKFTFRTLSSRASDFQYAAVGPVFGKFEYGVSDEIGLGLDIAYFYANAKFDYLAPAQNGIMSNYLAQINLNSYSVLARFNYHFGVSDKLDPYLGFGVGYRGGRRTYIDNNTNFATAFNFSGLNRIFPVGFEATIGLRFYVIDNLAIYGELGAAKSVIQFGLSYKI